MEQYDSVDDLPDQALDDLTALAAQICEAPIALISFLGEKKQWFKSQVGIEGTEHPREFTFCTYALYQSELLIVPDTQKDPRFAHNPYVTGKLGAPLISPEGAVIGTLCIVDRVPREVTPSQQQALKILARQAMTHFELRRQTHALKFSEERFSNAFNYAPIGMALVSPSGHWLKVNQAVCALLGYTAEELFAKTFQEITHPDDLSLDLEYVQTLLDGKVDSYHMEKRYFHKQGHLVWAHLGVSLVKDKQGRPLYFISQIQDITESKRILAQQQELTQQALAADRAKSQFLAVMSHEIRTPMNGVIGMTNILADTELTEMQRDCVDTINTSGESLLSVINDVLDYSKIEAGRLQLEKRSFNLRECVESVLDLFTTPIRLKHLEVVYLIALEIPTHLVGDVMRLRQILVNLIGNAVKFTAQGEINLTVALQGNEKGSCELLFSIADTGIGISEAGMETLFHAFQQVDSSTTRKYGGTGLGLVISRRLAEIMEGTMWVESEWNVGSTFFFTARFDVGPAQTQEPTINPERLRHRSALVVDDNATNRHVLDLQLRAWGMEVTAVATGEEVLKLVPQKNFDVILVDYQMPFMDGVTLAREIRRERMIPLILLSSSGEIMVGAEAELFSAQVPKPIKLGQLLEALLRATGDDRQVLRRAQEVKLSSGLASRHPLRILLAEDNTVNQKVVLNLLSRFGYSADLAGNGKLAVEATLRKNYDLILMDIQMPEMNGTEAMRQIRQRFKSKSPYVIALTAEALSGDKERFLASGFDCYLSKPLQARLFEEVLSQVPLLGVEHPR